MSTIDYDHYSAIGSGTLHTTSATTIAGTAIAWDTSGLIVNAPNVTYADSRLKPKKKRSEERIPVSPKVFFNFVKTKMNKTQRENLEERLMVLKEELEDAKEIGQWGLYEIIAKRVVEMVEIQELYVMGIDRFFRREAIEKAMKLVGKMNDDGELVTSWNGKKCIFLEKLENFPRPIPKDIQAQIKRVKRAGLFKELWVLYLDYTKEGKLKTTANKIREKDPVLFGMRKLDPDNLYYICDWVDEVCDLTLDKILDDKTMRLKSEVMETPFEIDQTWVESLKVDLEEGVDRLAKTRMSNWKDVENDQKIAEARRSIVENEMKEVEKKKKPKRSFFAKLLGK